ncbi:MULTISPECIES: FAD-binding oxidoreductase [unclassified Nocardia]|uniref:FAD-binding oxidoreductase n=1 Tax=unclassified Nocardia TaxID=2637762 RepID=UPI001CE44BB2|nr:MULTISPECIES: FAD-binding oxidoreductase [unclassified Nocardia]
MDDNVIQPFRAGLAGTVIVPGEPGYDRARAVHNGLIDRKPALIVRCIGAADIRAALRFAVAEGLPVAIRGGGHSVAGHGTCDGGLLVDLSMMRGVRTDPLRRTVRVQGGATLGDLDRETQLHGLATPSGQVSKTGIAGLTLSGGMGMLQRKYGLTCDNLLSADIVTADGSLVRASETEDAELFWALRGGGGNFGVVTSFEFRAHPVTTVYGGLIAYPIDRAAEVLAFLRDFIADAPEELSADAIFQHVPPIPVFPAEHIGKRVIGIFVRYAGTAEAGAEAIRPIRAFGTPIVDFVAPMDYTGVQSLLDPLNPFGGLNYWTGEYLPAFGAAEIDAVAEIGATLPSGHSIVEVIPFNAAPTRIPTDATAFAQRTESWLIHVMGQWQGPADTERCRDWARAAGRTLRAFSHGNTYLNLVGDDEDTDRVRACWDDRRLARLAAVKARCDPDNMFRFNHNIALAEVSP